MTKFKTPKIEELFDAGVHIGHQARRWHPKMEKYLYSVENKIHIFDLEQTHDLLKAACEQLFEIAKKNGQVIFVGTKRQASKVIKDSAKKGSALYVNERWLGGTITNFKTIKKNMDKLVDLIRQRETGELQKYTKKERLLIDRAIEKLDKYVGGLVGLRGAPAALVVIDPRKEKTAVREALKSKIPVIALVDTNTDPSNITFPIPGNDDAIKSISLIADTLAQAVEMGYVEFGKAGEKAAEEATKVQTAEKLEPLIVKAAVKDEIVKAKDLPVVVEAAVSTEVLKEEGVKAVEPKVEKTEKPKSKTVKKEKTK